MICAVIKGPSYTDVRNQIALAAGQADLVELRIDLFEKIDDKALHDLLVEFPIPMIFTLRSREQGGHYSKHETERQADIRLLAQLKPAYCDLEYSHSQSFVAEISQICPVILSYHDFDVTPDDLDVIWNRMRRTPASLYKIALKANSSTDALRLLCYAKGKQRLIPISMGAAGQVSRILAPVVGSPLSYASLNDELTTAPGQLSIDTLASQYHFHSLSPSTAIYGLIGGSVNQSVSDVIHNARFKERGTNAVYVKMEVAAAELPEFIKYCKELPFSGLSVTMPLKEKILPYLDKKDPAVEEIGACNTLLFRNGAIIGFNTDGIGALNAIGPVKGKRVVIIGAGGSAKAIAYEAIKRGATVTVLNRDKEKALALADRLGCLGGGLDHMVACAKEGYDVLINCTPAESPIDPQSILPGVLVMDIKSKATPDNSPFLKQAQKKGCRIVSGFQMFLEQASGQFAIWNT